MTGISPSAGATDGGQTVTITGANFLTGATVTFGGVQATNVSVDNDKTITCQTPGRPSPGTVSVIVTNPGQCNPSNAVNYTYATPTVTVTRIDPSSGPTDGGTVVTVTGTGFDQNGTGYSTGATLVIGGSAASGSLGQPTIYVKPNVNGTTIIGATGRNAPGTYDVVVTVNGQ